MKLFLFPATAAAAPVSLLVFFLLKPKSAYTTVTTFLITAAGAGIWLRIAEDSWCPIIYVISDTVSPYQLVGFAFFPQAHFCQSIAHAGMRQLRLLLIWRMLVFGWGRRREQLLPTVPLTIGKQQQQSQHRNCKPATQFLSALLLLLLITWLP